jgi:hypothetical protein
MKHVRHVPQSANPRNVVKFYERDTHRTFTHKSDLGNVVTIASKGTLVTLVNTVTAVAMGTWVTW